MIYDDAGLIKLQHHDCMKLSYSMIVETLHFMQMVRNWNGSSAARVLRQICFVSLELQRGQRDATESNLIIASCFSL